MKRAPVGAHYVLLVAGVTGTRRLKGQPFSIVAEIRFGIFAAEGELSNRGESMLTGSWGNQSRGLCVRRSNRDNCE